MPLLAEVIREHPGALILQDPGDHLTLVVQPGILDDVVQRIGSTGLEIGGTVDEPVYARRNESPGAHGAGLECYEYIDVAQSPIFLEGRHTLKKQNFRVGGGIASQLSLVVSAAHDL